MVEIRLTRSDIDQYKREILETSVLIRLDEAATILAVHPRTVQRRVDEGKLVPYNDNNSQKGIRFLASELKRYVAEMRGKLRED